MPVVKFNLFPFISNRFPIAMKFPTNHDEKEIKLFLEEAKCMVKVGEYHAHIVNLQGIIYDVDGITNRVLSVSSYWKLDVEMAIGNIIPMFWSLVNRVYIFR